MHNPFDQHAKKVGRPGNFPSGSAAKRGGWAVAPSACSRPAPPAQLDAPGRGRFPDPVATDSLQARLEHETRVMPSSGMRQDDDRTQSGVALVMRDR